MYIKGHVKTVDTKDQGNAIMYCVCYVVCQHCRHKDQRMQCIELCILVFVALTYSTYISVHNFLNIQLIFNPKKFWKAQN